MPVKIISDSTCDLSEDLLQKYEIALSPLTVTLGGRSGHDGVDITPDDIYVYVERTGELSQTSAVSVGEYEEIFGHWRGLGFEIVHFCISAKLSVSYQNACLAAEEVGGVTVIDSANLSTGQGLVVLNAAEMAMAGASAEQKRRTGQQNQRKPHSQKREHRPQHQTNCSRCHEDPQIPRLSPAILQRLNSASHVKQAVS